MLEQIALKWAVWRNRLIASPKLRKLTPWFPWPARRYARVLFDLSAGFVYAQVTQALTESGLLARMAVGTIAVNEAATLGDLPPDAALTLLKAAEALRLVEQHGQLWTLGPYGAALAASPGVTEMIAHHRLLYTDLADPLAMLRGKGAGKLAALWRYDGTADPAQVAAYSALMAASQPMVAEQALAAFPFARHRKLLDVGGGAGAFVAQVRRAAPKLQCGIYDRPQVIEPARTSLAGTVGLHAGDFLRDPLPSGYDLISLVRILHDHDDDAASRLLKSVRAVLPPEGRLVIIEPLAGTRRAERMGHAYFGFYLAAMRSGRPRSWREYKDMLQRAGFRRVRLCPTPVPLIASVIVGQV